jgi:hypothetical protein
MSIATTPSGSVHGKGSRRARASSHSPADDMKLRQHHAHRTSESRDIVLYLAGVNEHAALRIVGNKRWRVSHLLWTIQCFSTMEFTS